MVESATEEWVLVSAQKGFRDKTWRSRKQSKDLLSTLLHSKGKSGQTHVSSYHELLWLTSYISTVQSLSRVWLFATPWITACQASLSITKSWSSLRLTSIESVMPSSHLILCRPLLLLPPIPPSIRVFSYELTRHMRWPKYWSFQP